MKKLKQISRKGIKAWGLVYGRGTKIHKEPLFRYEFMLREGIQPKKVLCVFPSKQLAQGFINQWHSHNFNLIEVLIIPQRVHSKGGKK